MTRRYTQKLAERHNTGYQKTRKLPQLGLVSWKPSKHSHARQENKHGADIDKKPSGLPPGEHDV